MPFDIAVNTGNKELIVLLQVDGGRVGGGEKGRDWEWDRRERVIEEKREKG